MARSCDALRAGSVRLGVPALRTAALALVVAVVAACCPAPLVPTGGTPTAFAAVVAEIDATSWVAEGPGGARVRVAGAPPAPAGARVYVSGALATDGSLVLDRADPLANP